MGGDINHEWEVDNLFQNAPVVQQYYLLEEGGVPVLPVSAAVL